MRKNDRKYRFMLRDRSLNNQDRVQIVDLYTRVEGVFTFTGVHFAAHTRYLNDFSVLISNAIKDDFNTEGDLGLYGWKRNLVSGDTVITHWSESKEKYVPTDVTLTLDELRAMPKQFDDLRNLLRHNSCYHLVKDEYHRIN